MSSRFNFVVPVMSESTAGRHWLASDNPDGRSVQSALNRSVTAMCNQTAPCIIHLVGHKIPDLTIGIPHKTVKASDGWTDRFDGSEPLIVVHEVDFPPPDKIDRVTYERLSGKPIPDLPDYVRRRVGDKYSKIKVGVGAVLDDEDGRFIMLMDHDDLLHRDCAAFALDNDGEYPGGHTVTKGYGWIVGRRNFSEVMRFFQVCGSCNAVRVSDEERDQWLRTRDLHTFDRKKHWLYAGHSGVHDRLRKSGRNTSKFPFHAAVYVTNTGANISGARSAGKGHVPFTDDIVEQFGLHISNNL